MLYTIMPLERIYSNRVESIYSKRKIQETNNLNDSEYRNLSLSYGSIYAKREGDTYIVERITSTDMSDYLNPQYAPGTTIDVTKFS